MQAGRRRTSTLRSRLLLLVLALAVPAVSLGAYASWVAYAGVRDRGRQRTLQIAQEASVSVATLLELAERQTRGVADQGPGILLDPSRCSDRIRVTRNLLPFYTGISVVDREGDLVCSALELPQGPTPTARDREWFRSLQSTGAFTISRPVLGRITGERVLVMAAPILDEAGLVVGAVSGGMTLEEVSRAVSRSIHDDVTVITVADSLGVVVLRTAEAEDWDDHQLPPPDDPTVLSTDGGAVFGTLGLDGVRRTVGRVDMKDTGWRVYASVPDAVLLGPGLALVRIETLSSLLFLAFALLVAIWAYAGIARSLRNLGESVAATALGLPAQVPEGAPKELVAVADQLNLALSQRARAEERYRSFLQDAPFGAYVSTENGTILEANAALAVMLGFDGPADLIGSDLSRVYAHPERRRELLERHRAPTTFAGIDVEWRKTDGSPLHVRLTGRSREDAEAGVTFEVIAEDVTAQRELEAISRHQQKVEAVSLLASGIAHDLNNVLTVIAGNSELLLEGLPPEHEMRGEANEISLAVSSAAALTRNLLAFSRRRVLETRALQVAEALDGLRTLIGRTLPASISLDIQIPDDLPLVWMDKGNLEQCILNLVVNARDAIDGSGTIRIRAEGGIDREDGGSCVVLSVTDDGAGMEPSVLVRATEAFFTTKEEGHGTGLGLPTVRNIVQDAGGKLHIESDPSRGTRVEIRLPAA